MVFSRLSWSARRRRARATAGVARGHNSPLRVRVVGHSPGALRARAGRFYEYSSLSRPRIVSSSCRDLARPQSMRGSPAVLTFRNGRSNLVAQAVLQLPENRRHFARSWPSDGREDLQFRRESGHRLQGSSRRSFRSIRPSLLERPEGKSRARPSGKGLFGLQTLGSRDETASVRQSATKTSPAVSSHRQTAYRRVVNLREKLDGMTRR